MSDKFNINAVEEDGVGVARELLAHPDVHRLVELLKSKIDQKVGDVGQKVTDDGVLGVFRDAIEKAVVDGLTEALTKKE